MSARTPLPAHGTKTIEQAAFSDAAHQRYWARGPEQVLQFCVIFVTAARIQVERRGSGALRDQASMTENFASALRSLNLGSSESWCLGPPHRRRVVGPAAAVEIAKGIVRLSRQVDPPRLIGCLRRLAAGEDPREVLDVASLLEAATVELRRSSDVEDGDGGAIDCAPVDGLPLDVRRRALERAFRSSGEDSVLDPIAGPRASAAMPPDTDRKALVPDPPARLPGHSAPHRVGALPLDQPLDAPSSEEREVPTRSFSQTPEIPFDACEPPGPPPETSAWRLHGPESQPSWTVSPFVDLPSTNKRSGSASFATKTVEVADAQQNSAWQLQSGHQWPRALLTIAAAIATLSAAYFAGWAVLPGDPTTSGPGLPSSSTVMPQASPFVGTPTGRPPTQLPMRTAPSTAGAVPEQTVAPETAALKAPVQSTEVNRNNRWRDELHELRTRMATAEQIADESIAELNGQKLRADDQVRIAVAARRELAKATALLTEARAEVEGLSADLAAAQARVTEFEQQRSTWHSVVASKPHPRTATATRSGAGATGSNIPGRIELPGIGVPAEWRGTSPALTESSLRDAYARAQPCLAAHIVNGETPRRLASRIGLNELVLYILNKNVLTLTPFNPATGLGDDDGRSGLEQPVRERDGLWVYVPPTIPPLDSYRIRLLTPEELRGIRDVGFDCSPEQIRTRLAATERAGLLPRPVLGTVR